MLTFCCDWMQIQIRESKPLLLISLLLSCYNGENGKNERGGIISPDLPNKLSNHK